MNLEHNAFLLVCVNYDTKLTVLYFSLFVYENIVYWFVFSIHSMTKQIIPSLFDRYEVLDYRYTSYSYNIQQ